jgi:hypothetical protein
MAEAKVYDSQGNVKENKQLAGPLFNKRSQGSSASQLRKRIFK